MSSAAATTFAAVFMFGAQPAGASGPAEAAASLRGPALWVVQDADTTIYLFGTFHALDARTSWFTRSVRAAFDASEELMLETLVPEDPAELFDILARQSIAGAPMVGQPVVAAPAAPSSFVASAGQAMSTGRSMGMSVDHGADFVLRRAAQASRKPVGGLESFEYQLSMFGSLPAPAKARGNGGPADATHMLNNLQTAWRTGDNSSLASVLGTMRVQSPQTYKIMFVDRNVNWAGWIAGRMQRPGTVFVAVGSGHLIGPDSVQHQLAARGIASARIS